MTKRSKKPTKPKTSPAATTGTAASMKAASARLAVPMRVLKTAKGAGCEAFHPSGRVDLGALTEWLGSHEGEESIDWEERLTKAQALLKEQQLRQREGQLVEVDEAVQMIREALIPVMQLIDGLPSVLCARCNPSDPQHARAALEAWVEQGRRTLADAQKRKTR